jgi:hypothetical protein
LQDFWSQEQYVLVDTEGGAIEVLIMELLARSILALVFCGAYAYLRQFAEQPISEWWSPMCAVLLVWVGGASRLIITAVALLGSAESYLLWKSTHIPILSDNTTTPSNQERFSIEVGGQKFVSDSTGKYELTAPASTKHVLLSKPKADLQNDAADPEREAAEERKAKRAEDRAQLKAKYEAKTQAAAGQRLSFGLIQKQDKSAHSETSNTPNAAAAIASPVQTKSRLLPGKGHAARQQRPVQDSGGAGGGGNPTMSAAEQKIALGRLLEKKRKNDLRGVLKAEREGTLNEYLQQDMIRAGITAAAFNGV